MTYRPRLGVVADDGACQDGRAGRSAAAIADGLRLGE